MKLWVVGLLALTVAACGSSSAPQPTRTRVEVIERTAGGGGGFDAQQIYRAEAPGVVTVVSIFGSGSADAAEGSGFVLNGAGEIATNAHVVTTGEGRSITRASQVYVEFADGNRVSARIVGQDPNADVALLRVDAKGLTLRPLPLGEDRAVKVGSPVAAIGSPFGQAQSLSVGIVSAVDRSVASLTNFEIPGAIQTDAAINPGNSGGPLVGSDGKVIGINQQIQSKSGGGEGVGFAVPIDIVKRSLDQLRSGGTAHYAYLGVSSVPLYPQLVQHFGLKAAKGAWIQQVTAGGPAARAGLRGGSGASAFQASEYRRGGDVITKVGGMPIAGADDLSAAVARFRPGQTIDVVISRDGASKTFKVKLAERPLGNPTAG